jgi:hypothetical protein
MINPPFLSRLHALDSGDIAMGKVELATDVSIKNPSGQCILHFDALKDLYLSRLQCRNFSVCNNIIIGSHDVHEKCSIASRELLGAE